jgi:hypothetical protein
MARAIALSALLTLAACSAPPAPPGDGGVDAGADAARPCAAGFVGDAGEEVELVVTALLGATATEVKDGDAVPLVFPPQGGRVIFAGVRARNLDTCAVTLTGVLRDPATKQVRLDARTVNLLGAADGWAETDASDYSTFSNIPVCPNEWSDTDVMGNVYELEITVADRGGRTGTKKLSVTPVCAEPALEAECRCLCHAGYKLGEACSDTGLPDAGAGDAGGGG